MAQSIAGINIKISSDTSGLQSGLSGAIGMLSNFGGMAGAALGGAIGAAAGQAIGGAIEGVLGAVTNVIGSSLGLAVANEQAFATFDALTGSAESATKMLERLKALDLESPLSFDNYQQGAKLLLGYGVEADKVVKLQEQLGKVSMGNSDKLTMLSLAMGQVAASGRLMGQDANQLAQSGFPALNLIAQKTGETFAEVKARMESGGVSFAEVQDALEGLTSGTGRFANINSKLVETLGGQWTKLQGDLALLGRELGEGLFPAAKEVVGAFSEMVAIAKEFKLGEMVRFALAEFTAFAREVRLFTAWLNGGSSKPVANLDDGLPTIEDISSQLNEAERLKDWATSFGDMWKKMTTTVDADATENQRKLESSAKSLMDSLKTPAEALNESIANAQNLFTSGLINEDFFDRAVNAALDKFDAGVNAEEAIRPVDIAANRRDTTAGFSAMIEALKGTNTAKEAEEKARLQRERQIRVLEAIQNNTARPAQFQVADV